MKNEVTPFSSATLPPIPQEISIQLGALFLGRPHQKFCERSQKQHPPLYEITLVLY